MDDFTAALQGDVGAQYRNIITSLALHLRFLARACPMFSDDVITTTVELASAALEFVEEERGKLKALTKE